MNDDAPRRPGTASDRRGTPSRPAVLALALLALGCRPEPSAEPPPTPMEPAPEAAPETLARPLVRPTTLPPVPPDPPAPKAPLPPGAPTTEGQLGELVAIDDHRALVRFFVPGPDHAVGWWLALMNRDGSIAWTQPCSGTLATNGLAPAIEVVGDAVTLVTSRFVGDQPRLELYAFSLADGEPRLHEPLGVGYPVATASDGTRRFDVRVHYDSSTAAGVTAELVASTAERVLWRATIGEPPPPGPDPTVIGEAVVVRSEERRRRSRSWQAFDRATGRPIGRLEAEPQSCSDGERWFVMQGDAIVAVDPKTLRTREVTGPLELPEHPGMWHPSDCALAGGRLVILVSRGDQRALVAYDPKSLERRGQAVLGAVHVGFDGFDPLQGELHEILALRTISNQGDEGIVVVDPTGKRPQERWRPAGEAYYTPLLAWAGGYLLPTRHTLAFVDGRTGALEGRAMIPEFADVRGSQIAGSTLWLPPSGSLRLGTRAPRIVDLGTTASDDVRGAVLHDLEPAGTRTAGRCPDPSAPLVGDGKGTDGTLGPVKRTRLPTWDIDILHETARLAACAPGSAISRLLAWHVMEDDRPLRNDYALMFVEDHSVEPPRYTLLAMRRHATNLQWSASPGSSHSREEPIRTFDHRPTRTEIDDYLAQSGWSFGDTWGRVLAGNVIDDEWRKALHAEPWRSYADGIERPD